jgi:hypothetical protein
LTLDPPPLTLYPMSRVTEYATRLFLHWLNERYRREFQAKLSEDGTWRATDPEAGDLAISTAFLYEGDDAWFERAAELEQRLDDTRPGSYLLWVPPGGRLPDGEPDESEWVRRVVLGASKLASGRSGEVRLPVKMAIGKVRDEGGYASVTGGLGRHWPDISHRLTGSFYLDSRGLNRLSRDEDERTQLFDHIGLLSQGLKLGDVVEFEHEDAWNLQRLPRGAAGEGMEDGWAIAGCPPGFEPFDGGPTRRLLRRHLAEANEKLRGVQGASRIIVLVGAFDYIDGEIAGSSLRGFDPALAAAFDVIALVSDADVKTLRLARGARFLREQ